MSNFLNLVQLYPWLLYVIAGFVSLSVGSFLNVVIYRLPLILKQSWHNDCQNFLHPDNPVLKTEKLSLSAPRSYCPSCKNPIKWYQNIPVVSWLALRGKCACCNQRVSFIYPAIELLTLACSMAVVYKFGLSWQCLLGLLLTWSLIALTFIDFAEQILPDRILYPLAALGLAASTYGIFTTPSMSIWGSLLGFLSLWIVYILFKIFTGKEGMGYGDFKLLAVAGGWFGPLALPGIIIWSSILGTLIGVYFLVIKKQSRPFAFGPYIAIAIWAHLIIAI